MDSIKKQFAERPKVKQEFQDRTVETLKTIVKYFLVKLGYLVGHRYSDYYFLRMNLIDDLYIKRRKFKELINNIIKFHNKNKKLTPLIIENGKVIIKTEPYKIMYSYHPEIEPNNSGENLDVVFLAQQRDKEFLDIIIDNLSLKDVFIDVGANIGHFSLHVSKRAGCACYAFEPVATNFEILKENILLNDLDIIAEKCALSNEIGTIYISTNLGTMGNRIAAKEGKNTVKVKTDTLDNYVKEHKINSIKFIKVDIQGAELFFLKGAENTIRRFRPIVMLENDSSSLDYGYSRKELFEWMYHVGYLKCISINGGKVNCIDTIDSNDVVGSDFIFYDNNIILNST